MFASEAGLIYPCCISLDDQQPNVDQNGRPFRISDPGAFSAAWNSDYSKDLRRKMMTGEQPSPCMRCFSFEDLGILSHRQSANKQFSHHIAGALAETTTEGWAPPRIRTADIRVGNFCNLKCRMCSPQSSKRLIDEWKLLYPEISSDYYDGVENQDWFESPEFYDLFLRFVPDIESLHFAGGEPLIVKRVFEIMRSIVDLGEAHHISLTYNTNLTHLPDDIYELWPKFDDVKVYVSLDGYHELNSYIRYPSNWDIIERNLKMLDRDREKLNVSYISVNATFQAYNATQIVPLLDFILDNFSAVKLPCLSLLRFPEALSAQVLPAQVKNLAIERLRDFVVRTRHRWAARCEFPDEARNFDKNIQGVIEFLLGENKSHLLPDFMRQTEIFDRSRKQDLLLLIPEFRCLTRDLGQPPKVAPALLTWTRKLQTSVFGWLRR